MTSEATTVNPLQDSKKSDVGGSETNSVGGSENSSGSIHSVPAVTRSTHTSGSSAVFGGGKGWESWGTEEGHRALGQAYQRHNNVHAPSNNSNDNDSYDVDEFGDLVSSTGSSLRNRGMVEESDTSTDDTNRRRSEGDASATNTSSSHHNSSTSGESGERSSSTSSDESPTPHTVHSRGYYSESVLHDKVIRPNLENKTSGLIPGLRGKFGKGRSSSFVGRSSFIKGMDEESDASVVAHNNHNVSMILEVDENSTADENNGKELRKNSVRKICFLLNCRRNQIICILLVFIVVLGSVLAAVFWPQSKPVQTTKNVAKASSQALSHLFGFDKDMGLDEVSSTEASPEEGSARLARRRTKNEILELSDLWEPLVQTDVPVYWHVPRTAGLTVSNILKQCLGLVTSSSEGSEPIQYGGASVIFTHSFDNLTPHVGESHMGRAFALFRNPVNRVASMFYYHQQESARLGEQELMSMNLLDYARSDLIERNWMVKTLLNQIENSFTLEDLEAAKDILRRKVLVGIFEIFDDSLARFENYFQWTPNAQIRSCQLEHSQNNDNRSNQFMPQPGSEEYELLKSANWADMELYEYAKVLFEEQSQLPLLTPTVMD